MITDIKAFKQQFKDRVRHHFGDLTFIDKSHEYFINGHRTNMSVSGVVKSFIDQPDWNKIASNIAKRDGTTKEAVLLAWSTKNKLACDNGTETHDFAEKLDRKAKTSKEEAVLQFIKYLGCVHPGRYILMAKELKMYHKIYRFPGTCDFVLFDRKTGKFIIGDWKTNEDLFKNYKDKTLLAPFDFLLDCPYNHYQIQLSLYEILFIQLGYLVSERWLIYLKEDATFEKFDCYDLTSYLYTQLAA